MPDVLWKKHKTPQDDSYIPKVRLVLPWSIQVVKASLYKMIFIVKVGTVEKHTWAIVTGWEVASVQSLGVHVDIILETSTM